MKKNTIYIAVLLLLLGSFLFLYLKKSAGNPAVIQNPPEQTANSKTPVKTEWKKYSFEKLGLSLSAPADMIVSENQANDNNSFSFTIQRSAYPDPSYYQLYATLQPTANMDKDAEGIKSQLVDGSKDIVIGGFQAIQGQYKGERNRYVTFIFTDRGVLNLATSQPTPENEQITNSILATFTFNRDSGKDVTNPTTEKAIQTILAQKYHKQPGEVSVKVTKEVPGFAAGSVLFGQGGPGEGGMWIALLGNGWEVVWDGNGSVDCNKMRQQYGIPDTILKPNFCE